MNVKEYILNNKILCGIILGVFVLFIIFGFQKEGYHVDEMYSYGLANSEYLPFMHFGVSGYDVKDWMKDYGAGENIGDLCSNIIKDVKIIAKAGFKVKETEIYAKYLEAQANSADTLSSSWVNGKDYEDYLTGGKSNRFNYASVYYNQRGDVHPPLYYIFLHTVCSVLEGKFTKWTGLGLNMVFMAAALVFIYEMCKSFLGGRESALTVTALYGISSAIMSVTVYIRMYALLTLITMICAYLHLSAQDRDYKLKKKDYLQLGGIVLLGYLTHYYFVLFILALAAVTTILMLVKKKYKPALFYVLTMAASGVTGLIVWPFSIRHVFSGYRGDQAFESLKSAYSFYKLNWNIQTSLGETAGKIGLPVAVLTIIAIVVLIILKKKKFPYEKMLILLIPSAFAVIVVSQICPFYSDRYLSNISPFFLIIPVYILTELVKAIQEKTKTKKEKKKINTALIVSLSVFGVITACFNNCFINNVNNLFKGGQETVEIEENTDCICVLPDGDWNEPAEDSMILAKCNKVGIVYESNIQILKKGYKLKPDGKILINVAHGLDADETVKKVQEELSLEDTKEINRKEADWCTRIWLSR